ncbi:MAG: hypothetical protein DRR06_16870 [Gammaproteobacteria bacterium]|nr:MAG: hypothetical protein DRR06_16870 [Gammaproteobacteria bacterium]RLA50006.1 MAG: hypothetical protein DRR42_14310 [Gammaproteobacteria bacterium]
MNQSPLNLSPLNLSPLNLGPLNQSPLNQSPLNQSPPNQDPLAQLRDIQLPEAVGWWPPAPGWWVLALVLILSTAFAIRYLVARRRRLQFRRQAKQLLSQCWATYQGEHDDRLFIETLFTILRRAGKTSGLAKHKTENQLIRGHAIENHSIENHAIENHAIENDALESHLPENNILGNNVEAMTAAQLFNMLEVFSLGNLSAHVSLTDIDNLLYHRQPNPLREEQAKQLYDTATNWLKRSTQLC